MVLENILSDPAIFPTAILTKEFFLPFILIFTLLWATLSMVKIFNSRINLVIAFVLAVLTAVSPVFTTISQYVLLIGPFTAVGIFVALFVVGGVMQAIGHGKNIYYESGGYFKKREVLTKKMRKLEEKEEKARDDREKRELHDEWKKLKDELEYLEHRYKYVEHH